MTGVVFEDANGNGLRDAGEPGVAGVRVSNGRDLVASAKDGSYRIGARPDAPVFAIKPADRTFGKRPDGLPASWSMDASQPFDVAQVFTGSPGVQVPLDVTIDSFKRVVAGEFDHLPEAAFYMVGGIDEVVKKAERMAAEAA